MPTEVAPKRAPEAGDSCDPTEERLHSVVGDKAAFLICDLEEKYASYFAGVASGAMDSVAQTYAARPTHPAVMSTILSGSSISIVANRMMA